MALTYTFQAKMVADGKGQLGVAATDLRHVMTTYGSVFMAVAAEGVDIESLADIKKKPYRVWLGSKASVFWPLNMAALEAHGVALEDIEKSGGSINTEGYGKLLAAVKDGRVDVAFFAGPTPYSLLMNLDSSKGFKFLGFSPNALAKYNEILPGTSVATIEAGSYTSDARSVQFPYVVNQVVVGSQVSESTVYHITKMMNQKYKEMHKLFAGATDIDPAMALKDNKLPLHPGAAKYYKEVGLTQ
jgi:TRAP transporter TAXI family solute receptor